MVKIVLFSHLDHVYLSISEITVCLDYFSWLGSLMGLSKMVALTFTCMKLEIVFRAFTVL